MKTTHWITALTVLSLLALPHGADAQEKRRRRAKSSEPAAAPAEPAPVEEVPAPPPVEPEPASAADSTSIEMSAPVVLADDSATEPPSSEGPLYERGGLAGANLVLGAKLGGGFSQPFGDLGSSFLTELEVGYTLPFLQRSIEVYLSGAYTQPKAEGKSIEDPRLPGPASYELVQQQAIVTLGGLYRLRLPIDFLRPYAAVGPRLYMMRTKISGKAGGESFGDNEETATKLGVFAALGAELHFGPGAAFFEASMAWAKLDGYVLRDTSAGAINLALGYRLFI